MRWRPRGAKGGIAEFGWNMSESIHVQYNTFLLPTATGAAYGSGVLAPSRTGLVGTSFPTSGANDTVSTSSIFSFLIPDSVKRVFHPMQGGHAMIANLVLYEMAVRNAANLNVAVAEEAVYEFDDSCPLPPSPACNGTSSDTWTGRSAAVSAVASFCDNYLNVRGKAGERTSATFNVGSLDYMSISIDWEDDYAIGEGQCNMWFDTLVDSCDVPRGVDNPGNLKHGGTIGYAANATLNIQPLVIRREWDKGKTTYHQCNGLDNKRYIDRDTLNSNIQDYCSQSAAQKIANSGNVFSKEYNTGTPDHVTLTTTWPSGPLNYQVFQNECLYYMSTIMDGCDVPSGGSNPMNWKHGGSMSDFNGIKYEIAPNADRAPAPDAPLGNCNSWYKLVFQSFDIYGGGWASGDYGKGPGGLLQQIKGCGATTNWHFEYFDSPHDDGTEWHAWGRLPIGTRRCVGRAITSAGGFSGGCSGNG